LKAQGYVVTPDNSVFKESPASLLKLKADMVSGFVGADGKPDEAAWKRANPEYWANWQQRYKAATAITPVPDASTNGGGGNAIGNKVNSDNSTTNQNIEINNYGPVYPIGTIPGL
jgi:hypothetical protein